MRNVVLGILFIGFFFSCKDRSPLNSTNVKEGTSQYALSNIYQYDSLTLFAEYKECGEWGGHSEIFKIYRDGKEIKATYTKDSVNCKAGLTRKIIYEKRLDLSPRGQEWVIEYIQNLLSQNFINNPPLSNAGEYYSVISSDSSLVISHYTTSHYDGFDNLRDNLLTKLH